MLMLSYLYAYVVTLHRYFFFFNSRIKHNSKWCYFICPLWFLVIQMLESDFKILKINVDDLTFEMFVISEEYEVIMTGKFFSFFY